MSDSCKSFPILSSFAIIPSTQFVVNALQESPKSRMDLQKNNQTLVNHVSPNIMQIIPQNICDHHGFEYIEFKVSIAPSDGARDMIPHHLPGHHSYGLALRGIHLSWHDRRSWLILRQRQFPQTTARTWRQKPDVVRNLEKIVKNTIYK